ncbi:hypothetical protein [Parasphingorhabdus cellanae]|uniref:Uncharacterized protein n=1 Tax=Parasphingorhabdus cellanae TaxID=2806553 RepID=A0ABX7SZA9_9SPHN|nr:hypothetical protein [Parasphingorhabdus cellanae]QTD54616.1 hypothetical protein J4G78_10065 [Parasphingorhabdus cellanae]
MIKDTRIKAANMELQSILKDAADQWFANQPDNARLTMSPDKRVYRARPKGFSKAISNVCVLLVESTLFRRKTNQQIVEHLQGLFSGYPVSITVLNKPLLPSHKTAIQSALNGKGWKIDLDRQNTPSKLKRALRAIAAGQEATDKRTFDATVIFTTSSVIVNDREYKISSEGRIRKNGRWIAVDTLESLLSSS